MKLSSLIRVLQEFLRDHGDLDVKCWPYDGQQNPRDVEVDVVEDKSGNIFVQIDEKP
jgi:hypothetical protein